MLKSTGKFTGFFLKVIQCWMQLLKKIVGTKNDRELKRLSLLLNEVNNFEPTMMSLSDDEFRQKLPILKKN